MQQLTGLDASFLYLETPEQLLHVCALVVVDPSTMPDGYSFPALRAEIDRRIEGVPHFTRKLRQVPLGLDHPIWVPDQHFDIEHHVHRLGLPQPGGREELMELCGHLAGQQLDRSRPLWEMFVIEGYDEGKVAIFAKMHHATVDGLSGASLLSHLCSLEPGGEPLRTEDTGAVGRDPGVAELAVRAVGKNLARPLGALRLVSPSTQLITRTIERARRGTAMAAPLTAPRTPFNATITGRRVVSVADLDLAEVKEVKAATGATVNDVVLGLAGGALRRYLQARDALPDASLLAVVPVSVRDTSRREAGANKVSALFARLESDVADPIERLERLATTNRHAKEHQQAISADALQDWAEFAAPRTFGLAVRAYAGLRLAERHPVVHNLVLSNVPGPPFPLYFAGARIEGLYPLGPIMHGAGLNITVLSNAGRVHVGLIACRDLLPDLDDLAAGFPEELARMLEAVRPG